MFVTFRVNVIVRGGRLDGVAGGRGVGHSDWGAGECRKEWREGERTGKDGGVVRMEGGEMDRGGTVHVFFPGSGAVREFP
jgi:hypothetical protein